MTDKAYNDPKTLARLYYTLSDDGTATYSEIAEELECGVGTVSMRFNEDYYPEIVEQVESMGPEDFQDGKAVEELDEIEESELLEVVAEQLADWAETTQEDGVLYCDELDLFTITTTTHVQDALNQAYDIAIDTDGVLNPCVAVSEHLIRDEMVDRFEGEGIALLSVSSDDVVVRSDADLTVGSGVRSLFEDGLENTLAYRQAAWLSKKLESNDVEDLCRECSVLPATIRGYAQRYDIPIQT